MFDMTYPLDPGGIFDSDVHRRVLAAVPHPDQDAISFDEIIARLDNDPHVPLGTTHEEAILEVLADLKDDGEIVNDDGWQMTESGSENIQAAPPEAS